jgi:hypothetical protein
MGKSIRVYPRVVSCVGKTQRYQWGLDRMEIGDYMELRGHESRLARLAVTQFCIRRPTIRFLVCQTRTGATLVQRVDTQTKGIATYVIVPGDIMRDDLHIARVSIDFSKFRVDSWADIPVEYRRRVQQQIAAWNNTSPYLKIGTSTARSRGAQPGRCIIYTKGN